MRIQFSFLLLTFCLTSLVCNCQTNELTLSNVKFESIYGSNKDKSKNYCLIVSKLFQNHKAAYTDSLITDLISKHPKALVIPITYLNERESTIFCWLVDNKDTINNFLVHSGCYGQGAMIAGQFISIGPNFHITPQEYKTYIKQIEAAETFAKLNKIGRWKETSY